ncbi:peptidase S8/S53 domain-containing protein [Echria macrotheca]|uniref:Peptidase S8/S53 domain-containing protein n=1 Tax=Echria macrotheca TaxID=438768 RepID=A0AAJ0FFX8_9PEZI|nr:peptidase S8/S53 domain-containing protein [Echria macrotheca]
MKFNLIALAALVAAPLVLADAPITNQDISADLIIKDSYIVKYKDGADPARRKKHEDAVDKKAKAGRKKGVTQRIDIAGGLQGYVVEIGESDLKDVTSSDLVEYLEQDTIVSLNPPSQPNPLPLPKRALITQPNAPSWGLGRISHRARGNADYTYQPPTSRPSVRVYIIDTGIQTTHTEFRTTTGLARAVWGANFIPSSPNTDENGHGTHTAGTVAGRSVGIARNATVVAVKVLDRLGSGSLSGVISGINWAVSDASARGILGRAVINMSLGGSASPTLNATVEAAYTKGMSVVVAAGNSGADVAGFSPASAPDAITVAATDRTDAKPGWSNFGKGVDLFAPGVDIVSAWIGAGDNLYATASGTSMASPHVAGLAAYFIDKEGLASPAAVANRIRGAATVGVVVGPAGSPNRLAYNDDGL